VRIHRLHIVLAEISPLIWRRLDVPSHVNLEELHGMIQAAMGWLDYHLHAFEIDGQPYQLPDPENLDSSAKDEREMSLSALPQGSRFQYEYDFGDSWVHDIEVEAIHASDADLAQCVAGARACPPEDSGGPSGYENLVRILADPRDAEHAETLSWLGGPFDPEALNLQSVNAALVALYRDPPRTPSSPRRKRARARK
jgi:pRiA4b ORF-3-like protein